MREKLVIWGAGSQALIVADIIRLREQYEIVGFLDNINRECAGTEFCGALILGGEEQLDALRRQGVNNLICAVGMARARLQLTVLARAKGFQLVTAIHPRAVIASGVSIGAGTVIMAGAVVNPAARVGENAIINVCASVDHECTIEDAVLIGPGAHLGGGVTVERSATVEIGATIAGGLRIGAESVVGAGSVVLADIPSRVLAYGIPAKVIRSIP